MYYNILLPGDKIPISSDTCAEIHYLLTKHPWHDMQRQTGPNNSTYLGVSPGPNEPYVNETSPNDNKLIKTINAAIRDATSGADFCWGSMLIQRDGSDEFAPPGRVTRSPTHKPMQYDIDVDNGTTAMVSLLGSFRGGEPGAYAAWAVGCPGPGGKGAGLHRRRLLLGLWCKLHPGGLE